MADPRSFVIQNPEVLDNGLVVPQEIGSGRAARVVDALVPKDPEKPMVIQARAPEGLVIPQAGGVKAIITSASMSSESYPVETFGGDRVFVGGLVSYTAEVTFLPDGSDPQTLSDLRAGQTVTFYVVPDVPRPRTRSFGPGTMWVGDSGPIPMYGGTVSFVQTGGTSAWPGAYTSRRRGGRP